MSDDGCGTKVGFGMIRACQRSWTDPQRWRDAMADSRVLQHESPTPHGDILYEWDLEDEGLMNDRDHCGGCHEENEVYCYRLPDGRKAFICCCGEPKVAKRLGVKDFDSACPADGCLKSEYHRMWMTHDWRLVGEPHRRTLVKEWA